MGQITLSNIGGGAAVEKFSDELRKVVANIMDPNTPASAKREITIKVSIKPSVDRAFGPIVVSASSKLAPVRGFSTVAHFGMDGDEPVAFEDDPKQLTIGDFIENSKATTIKPKLEASK